MFKLVKSSDASLRQITDTHWAKNYITKGITKNISLAVVGGDNLSMTEKTAYNRIYYVLSGLINAKFGEEIIQAGVGDSLFVAAGTQYLLEGSFEAVVVNQPAFGTI